MKFKESGREEERERERVGDPIGKGKQKMACKKQEEPLFSVIN